MPQRTRNVPHSQLFAMCGIFAASPTNNLACCTGSKLKAKLGPSLAVELSCNLCVFAFCVQRFPGENQLFTSDTIWELGPVFTVHG